MKLNCITMPTTVSEFEVQAELYWAIKSKGIEGLTVRGEVGAICDDYGPHKCRFDLVIFDSFPHFTTHYPILIIEVKNWRAKMKHGRIAPLNFNLNPGRQLRRYSKFNVQILKCPGIAYVNEVAALAESHISKMRASAIAMLQAAQWLDKKVSESSCRKIETDDNADQP